MKRILVQIESDETACPNFVKSGTTPVQFKSLHHECLQKQLEESKGSKNFFGIRPENLTLSNNEGLKGSVFGVEYLGSRKILTIETIVGNVKIRVDSDTNVQVNDQVQFNTLNNNQIIFDGSTDKALLSEFIS